MFRLLLSLGVLTAFAPARVLAHGVGQRIDLPIPLELYIVGGVAVVALSFVVIWFLPSNTLRRFENYPKVPLKFLNWLSYAPLVHILKTLVLLVFLLALYAGFFGANQSALNLLPTSVWVVFSIGVTFFTAFFGNIWRVLNPLATLFEYATRLVTNLQTPQLAWKSEWGIWPAVWMFLLFRWVENIYPHAAEPHTLALVVLSFSIYSLIGMWLFGKSAWLTHADPFAVFFSFLSRFAPIEVVRSDTGALQFYLRPPAAGLLKEQPTTPEVFFVLLMVSGVTADGFFDTPLMGVITTITTSLSIPAMVTQTVVLVSLFGMFAALYYAISWVVSGLLPNVIQTAHFAQKFVLSLLPIAVAYEFAHYASLLLLEGQRFIALLSDPLGKGWNLIGTTGLEINYTLINLKSLWNVQVAAIVIGHVLAVFVAHAIAERVLKERGYVLASQYPMLLIMLLYTMFSLWIIAQPVVV